MCSKKDFGNLESLESCDHKRTGRKTSSQLRGPKLEKINTWSPDLRLLWLKKKKVKMLCKN